VKRVLLTGAGGFIGSHVLAHILDTTDWNVTLIGREPMLGRITEVVDSRPGSWKRVSFVKHDLRESFAPLEMAVIRGFAPYDVIINCASVADVDRSIADPRSVIAENVAMMVEMLELARRIEPDVFIHVSTGEVYGAAPMGRPSREWDPVLPPNPYSASKAAQEAIAIAYRRSYDVPLILVNCQNVFGERQQPERFVPKTIARILAGEPVPIYSTNGVPNRRTFTYAGNIADALCILATVTPRSSLLLDGFPARYNVTGEIEVDNLKMATQIAVYAGMVPPKRSAFVDVDTATLRPGHDARYALDAGKLADLGWKPPMTFAESLERTVRWTLAHPEWLT
jgi:dTDP-glucose 4,6-dehydratase